MAEQVLSLYAARYAYIDDIRTEDIGAFEHTLHQTFKASHADILAEIEEKGVLSEALKEKIDAIMKEIVHTYQLMQGER